MNGATRFTAAIAIATLKYIRAKWQRKESLMPTNNRQKKMQRYRDRALDPNESPMRRLRAAKSLVELAGFSQRTCPVARRVANELLNPEMPQEIRDVAIRLLENVAAGEATRLSVVRQETVAPVESVDDEIERVVNGEFEPIPRGVHTAQPEPVEKPAAPKPARRSAGIRTFEDATAFIQGLAEFDFSDRRGLETVCGKPWTNFQEQLMESIGQIFIPHDLFADIGGEWREDQRSKWSVEKMKAAVVAFADRSVDPTKPGHQFRVEDWRVVPITAAKQSIVTEAPIQSPISETVKTPIPARVVETVLIEDTVCSICQNTITGPPIPPHDCSLFQTSTVIGTRDVSTGASKIPFSGVLPAIMPGQNISPSRATCRICSVVQPGQAPPQHDCQQFQF
jgi:hypothetical protein